MGLGIEYRAELRVWSDPRILLGLLRERRTESAVLCTHRETLEAVLLWLAAHGCGPIAGLRPMEPMAMWEMRGSLGDHQVRIRQIPTDPWVLRAGTDASIRSGSEAHGGREIRRS